MIRCPSAACKSVNVVHLPHYWQSLPGESPLKARYAPPNVPGAGGCLSALGTAAIGVLAVAKTDAIWMGLLIVAIGIIWGVTVRQEILKAERQLEEWKASRLCLACTGQFWP